MSFSEIIIHSVWEKGRIHAIFPSHQWRVDQFGSLINRAEYNNRESESGWEIDHIIPVSEGGTDNLSNLRPLQWRNNLRRNSPIVRLIEALSQKPRF